MHGDTAGLESTDPGSEGDPGVERSGPTIAIDSEAEIIEQIEDSIRWLYEAHEYKAAREVEDSLQRWKSLHQGIRRSEAAHGQAPSDAQVDAFPT